MSVSFDITESMLYREFSVEESSAIRAISVLGKNVTIAYHSNPEKQYIMEGSVRFIPHIRAILTNFNKDEHSMGTIINNAKKTEDLIKLEI
jgi:hypothetical protein